MRFIAIDGRHILACVGMLIILCLYFTGRPWPELAVAVTAIVSLLSVLISSITKESVAQISTMAPPAPNPPQPAPAIPVAAGVPFFSNAVAAPPGASTAPMTLDNPPGGLRR